MSDDMKILQYLEAGLRAEGARQQAIANNVANINTPGYRRTVVRFEEVLAKAIERGQETRPDQIALEFIQPHDTPVNGNGNDVSLDMEVGEMVKNSLRHETYMLLLKKKYAQIQEAIRVP